SSAKEGSATHRVHEENLPAQGAALRGDGAIATSLRSCKNGDPGGARTPNPQFRRLMLYPIELRGRMAGGRCSRAPLDRTAEAAVPTHRKMGWETGIEPATAGATVRCSAS